jgi:flavin reductase ActVB
MQKQNEQLANEFRQAMGGLASGVTVITTWIDGRPWGLTVSACCSVSMSPPLILVCLANHAVSTTAILEQRGFGVNVMAEDQMDTAKKTAAPGQPKFIEEMLSDIQTDTPFIKGSLSYIHCQLQETVVAGDHTIFIGKVNQVMLGKLRDPLVYFNRQFQGTRPVSAD